MKYRVVITDGALAAVEEHLDYLDQQTGSTELSQRWWRKALAAVESLERWPNRCPVAPEDAYSEDRIRAILVDRCLFLFKVSDDERVVRVFGFRHGAQQPLQDPDA